MQDSSYKLTIEAEVVGPLYIFHWESPAKSVSGLVQGLKVTHAARPKSFDICLDQLRVAIVLKVSIESVW